MYKNKEIKYKRKESAVTSYWQNKRRSDMSKQSAAISAPSETDLLDLIQKSAPSDLIHKDYIPENVLLLRQRVYNLLMLCKQAEIVGEKQFNEIKKVCANVIPSITATAASREYEAVVLSEFVLQAVKKLIFLHLYGFSSENAREDLWKQLFPGDVPLPKHNPVVSDYSNPIGGTQYRITSSSWHQLLDLVKLPLVHGPSSPVSGSIVFFTSGTECQIFSLPIFCDFIRVISQKFSVDEADFLSVFFATHLADKNLEEIIQTSDWVPLALKNPLYQFAFQYTEEYPPGFDDLVEEKYVKASASGNKSLLAEYYSTRKNTEDLANQMGIPVQEPGISLNERRLLWEYEWSVLLKQLRLRAIISFHVHDSPLNRAKITATITATPPYPQAPKPSIHSKIPKDDHQNAKKE